MDEKEYIEREAVIEMANELYTRHLTLRNHEIGSAILDFNQSIKKAPAANVVTVRRGKWVDRYGGHCGDPVYICTACGHSATWGPKEAQVLTNYCPYCGTYMDGKGKDE